jgi:hypothetical protein
VVCFELGVVGRIGRQHKRKDWVVGAEINLAMSRRETREGWKDVVLGLTERQEELVEQREPQMTC